MKILVLFVLAVAVLIIVAQVMGWKNLGNLPPAVATKIAQIKGEPSPPLLRRIPATAETTYGVGQKSCRNFLEAMQGQQPVDAYLDWVEGFLTARAAEYPLSDSLIARPRIQAALQELCVENPDGSIATAAAALAERLTSQTLR
ncbi:MAG: hypothetical protein WBK91_02850 [Alphaproteobacteria bacterium]